MSDRIHHMDALRAAAMLLGILLHASLAYIGAPWAVQDGSHWGFGLLFCAVHGFRMQLFFLLSGYFTAMLWQHRGSTGAIRNRCARILVPLALGLVTIVPLTWVALIAVGTPEPPPPGTAAPGAPPGPREAVVWALFRFPLFHHLWFLWLLSWLIAGYAALDWVLGRVRPLPRAWPRGPVALVCLVAVTALTVGLMDAMREAPGFGPDTSTSILPLPGVLMHYAVFFGFGAVAYGLPRALESATRGWWAMLAVSAVILPFAIGFAMRAPWTTTAVAHDGARTALAWVLPALYAWLATLGCIGLAARLFGRHRPAVRYVSDSAYWLYLAHLPLIIAGQAALRNVAWPPAVKFGVLVAGSTVLLLASYHWLVRDRWIGRMLNGAPRAPLRSHECTTTSAGSSTSWSRPGS